MATARGRPGVEARRRVTAPADRADEEDWFWRLGEQLQGRTRGYPDFSEADVGTDYVARADGRIGRRAARNPREGVANRILLAGEVLNVAEVELLQEFQPTKEPLREVRHSLEVFQALVVAENLEGSANEEVTPDAEGFANSQKLLLASRVVLLRVLKLPRVEGDRVGNAMVELMERSANCLMFSTGVRYEFRWQFGVEKL